MGCLSKMQSGQLRDIVGDLVTRESMACVYEIYIREGWGCLYDLDETCMHGILMRHE